MTTKKKEVKRKKLAIVGCSDSRRYAPIDDPAWEIWGVNNLFYHLPMDKIANRTKWFEIHKITFDGNTYLRRGERDFRGQPIDGYLADMGKLKCPVYMQKHWDIVPTSIPYPLKEILSEFGNYFTNTISWMIALGIYEEFEEIGVWGVDMAVDSEYGHQRPSCEYFIGMFDGICKAKGKKTRLYMPPQADLCKTRFLYGFQETEFTAWQKKMKDMKVSMVQRQGKAEKKMRQAEREMNQYIGALHAQKEIDKIWR